MIVSGGRRPAWEVFRDSTRDDVRAFPFHGGPLHGRVIRWPIWMTASHQEGGVEYVYGLDGHWDRARDCWLFGNRMVLAWATTIPVAVPAPIHLYQRTWGSA